MAGVDLNADTTLDLWLTTQAAWEWKDTRKMEYLLARHNYPMMEAMANKERLSFESGTQIQRDIVYRELSSGTWVLPGEARTSATGDAIIQMKQPMTQLYSEYQINEKELSRNAGRAKLKDLLWSRRMRAMVGIAETVEAQCWALPDTASNKKLYGIPYFLPPITGAQVTAGTGAGAHQGIEAAAFTTASITTVSNINPTTYARWKSYNATWSNSSATITEADLLRVGRMFRRLHFKAPPTAGDLRTPKYGAFGIYTDETIIDAWTSALRGRRDDLGPNDPAKYYGAGLGAANEPMFKGLPLTWVDELDTASATVRGANPLYMVNWNYLRFAIETGFYFMERKPEHPWNQPDISVNFVDLSANLYTENRQLCGGLISYVAAA